MNIEQQIDELLPYVDQRYHVPQGGRTFPHNVPIHEAGHAIVREAIYGKRPTAHVFVEPETGSTYGLAGELPQEGETRQPMIATHQSEVFEPTPDVVRSLIKFCAIRLAGLASEAMATDQAWRYALIQRRIALHGQDAADCLNFCEVVKSFPFTRVAVPSWALAWRILEARWPDVEALAASIEPTNPPPHVRQYFNSMGGG